MTVEQQGSLVAQLLALAFLRYLVTLRVSEVRFHCSLISKSIISDDQAQRQVISFYTQQLDHFSAREITINLGPTRPFTRRLATPLVK